MTALEVLGNLAIGFTGGLAAALLAFERFKKEQQFDRCADWYERAFRGLSGYMSLLRDFDDVLNRSYQPGELTKLAEEFERSAYEGRVILDESVLFATAEIRDALERAAAEMQNMANPQDIQPVFGSSIEQTLRQIEVTLNASREAIQLIVAEYRKHLGLKAFPIGGPK